MKNFLNEFKEFVSKGSVVDMAVGVIVGGAFKDLTGSLVDTLINPLIGLFLGQVDLSSIVLTIGDANFKFGMFINALIEFIMVMFVIFLIVKAINRMRALGKKEEEAEEASIVSAEDYLKDIRDLLQSQENKK
ncbi:large-conductance mechanosensitive channel [Companilactobacillus sp. RD055328]|uniref:large conductance mechanosensitive channel protein MscL n=1 Tax=Companilactobacillus sp. RD055328 TaxID=2916634 RepID=UPI0020859D1C|nr:large conductance mechanosensitive channel protein MscL [Companilactobacillus sp. RD055328]GKQ42310.1 large-conductance mechanosensitive channel [Companilactobacillus sp. RD055328]